MAIPPIIYATELQSTNKLAPSIALEESDNILGARIDSTKNQGNTDGFPISDVVDPFDTGIYTTAALAKPTVEPETLPNAVASIIYTSPTQRALDRLIGEDDLFEDGYDSDGKIGPFSDEQVFDEDELGKVLVAAAADKEDGGKESRNNAVGGEEEEDEDFDHIENLNAIKAMDLKIVKEELYLRLEISSGKKAELQERNLILNPLNFLT